MGEWVSIKVASKRLNISYPRLLRLVQKGALQTKDDVLDARIKLVDLDEVKRLFRIEA
jgi:hypothetical protein